jgi:hypothetical protein
MSRMESTREVAPSRKIRVVRQHRMRDAVFKGSAAEINIESLLITPR